MFICLKITINERRWESETVVGVFIVVKSNQNENSLF